MNVNDVKFVRPDGDMLELIFEKQKSLAEKYHHIEESQGVGYGLLQNQVFDINNIRSQELLKNFAWRVTEEITEATDCNPKNELDHMLEELADALHFLVELCLLVNITPDNLVEELRNDFECPDKLTSLCSIQYPTSKPDPYPTVQQLGLAMNCLKNKPWKETHVLTDVEKFRKHIIFAFHEFCTYWVRCGSNNEEIYNYYFRKNKVNEFRIASKY